MSDELPTSRSISRTGYRVHVCKSCLHAKNAARGDVPLVRLRWRCGNCGSDMRPW